MGEQLLKGIECIITPFLAAWVSFDLALGDWFAKIRLFFGE